MSRLDPEYRPVKLPNCRYHGYLQPALGDNLSDLSMHSDGELDVKAYSDSELLEAAKTIDKISFPKNWRLLERELAVRNVIASQSVDWPEHYSLLFHVLGLILVLGLINFTLTYSGWTGSFHEFLLLVLVNSLFLAIFFWRVSTAKYLRKTRGDDYIPILWIVTFWVDLLVDIPRAVFASRKSDLPLPAGFFAHVFFLLVFILIAIIGVAASQ